MAVTTTTMIVMGAMAAMSALSAVQQGEAAKDQADAQADIAEQQAASEREVSAREAQAFERDQKALLARSRATQAASGIKINTGTPLLTDRASVEEIEVGKGDILKGGEIRATRLQQEASLQRKAGDNAQTAGYFKAGTSLLTSAARFG